MATELDFNTIKQELKEYLKSQPEFTDYNFEGSNLNVLLDILAYNTHYNALYANMIVNEQFLDSAIKRANVVSLAKHLGYVPRSKRAAEARIDMTTTRPGENQLTLQKWLTFTGKKDGESIPFVLIEPATEFSVDGDFSFSNLWVKQGTSSAWSFTVTDPQQKFELPSADIDLSALEVTVFTTGDSSTFTRYEQGSYYKGYDTSSPIYFVEENANGFYDLYFSDGVIGRPVAAGNVIEVRYLVTDGPKGNDIHTFTTSVPYNEITLSDPDFASSGGAGRESMDSVKFNAPRFYSSQGRAVTGEDYTNILLSEIPDIESIIVWGGEEETPPKYGQVFVSIKPFGNTRISRNLETRIKRTLQGRGVISIRPEVIEPDYIHVGLTIHSIYDDRKVVQVRTIQENILAAADDYFQSNLQKFDRDFRFSKFVSAMDASNEAIESTLVSLTVQKRVVPSGIIDTSMNNKLVPGSLYSSRFYKRIRGLAQLGALIDGADGKIYFQTTVGDRVELGTVNYQSGHIRFTLNRSNLPSANEVILPENQPDSIYFIDDFAGFHEAFVGERLKVTAAVDVEAKNLKSMRNQILVIDDTTNNVTTQEREGLRIVVEETQIA